MIRIVALIACLLTVAITGSSAFIRHWQAGLGCDGWPACHERGTRAGAAAPQSQGAVASAVASLTSPEIPAPVRAARALHRVSAMVVGVMVIGLVLFGWGSFDAGRRLAAAVALLDTLFLAWLGRYTPHDLPLVTIGNVAGGFVLAAAFAWMAGGRRPHVRTFGLAALAFALLCVMTWLGVMIGARGEIAACPEPLCVTGAAFDAAAFDPTLAEPAASDAAASSGASGAAGSGRALHLAHRGMALVFALAVVLLSSRLARGEGRPPRGGGGVATATGAALLALLAAQGFFGYATASGAMLPLLSATAHNVVAALFAVVLGGLLGGALTPRAAPGLPGRPRGSAGAAGEPSPRDRHAARLRVAAARDRAAGG